MGRGLDANALLLANGGCLCIPIDTDERPYARTICEELRQKHYDCTVRSSFVERDGDYDTYVYVRVE